MYPDAYERYSSHFGTADRAVRTQLPFLNPTTCNFWTARRKQCLAAAERPESSTDRARWEKGLARHAVAADWRLKATSYQTGRAKTVHTQPGAFPLSECVVLYVTSTRAARRGFTTHGTSAI